MGSEAESTPKLSLYSLPISRPLEMQSPPPPPLETLASIPFQWEEAPGKPRPTATPPVKSKSLELPPRLLSESVKMTNMASPMTVLEGPYLRWSGSRTWSFSSSPKIGSFRSPGAAEDDRHEGLRYRKREMSRMFSSRRWRSLNRGESDATFDFNSTSSVFGGFEKKKKKGDDSKAVRRSRSLFSFSDATSNLLQAIMKGISKRSP
ncbi:hypothetical protein LguiB_003786 [Lonicera macranthoides]